MDELERINLQFDGFQKSHSILLNGGGAFDVFDLDPRLSIPALTEDISPEMYIGKRAEVFLKHYFSHHSGFDLLLDQFQIIEHGKTLGELDFIVRTENHEYRHIELAYKFYLFQPQAPQDDRWIGPNHKDRLSAKIEKFVSRQLPMSGHPSVREHIKRFTQDERELEKTVCLVGMLFIPYGSSSIPHDVNSDAVKGFWIKEEAFFKLDWDDITAFIPAKIDWMIDPSLWTEWLPMSELKPEVQHRLSTQRSPMIWMKHPDGRIQRMFVVWW